MWTIRPLHLASVPTVGCKKCLFFICLASRWLEAVVSRLTALPHVEDGDNTQSHSHLIGLSDFAA